MNIQDLIIGAFVGGAATLIIFFVKEYFRSLRPKDPPNGQKAIDTRFQSVEKDIARIEGSIKTIDDRSHKSYEKLVEIQSELKAVWRTIDPPSRTSDKGESHD